MEALKIFQAAQDALFKRGPLTIGKIFWSHWLDRKTDREFSIETAGRDGEEFEKLSPSFGEAALYGPTRARPFLHLLHRLNLNKDFGFVDLGAGKGRVLVLAAHYGFRKVVGLEVSERLHEICEINFRNYLSATNKSTEWTLDCLPCEEFQMDSSHNVFYIYPKFEDSILQKIFSNIEASLNEKCRPVYFICHDNLGEPSPYLETQTVLTTRRSFENLGNQFYIYSNMPMP